MCFDARLTLYAPLAKTTTYMFGRYWVSKDRIRFEIRWAEPHWNTINYSYYPVGLWVSSDSDLFSMGHAGSGAVWRYPKPIAPRGAFSEINNDYSIENLRYVESEAAMLRVTVGDLGTSPGAPDSSSPIPLRTNPIGDVATEMREGEEYLSSLMLGDSPDSPLKKIRYFYNQERHTSVLKRIQAELVEHTIRATGVNNLITISGVTSSVNEIPLLYHRGNRVCDIQYQEFNASGRKIRLPSKVEVSVGSPPLRLRSAVLSNYRFTNRESPPPFLHDSSTSFTSANREEAAAQGLLNKYWLQPADRLSALDRNALLELEKHFLDTLQVASDTETRLRLVFRIAIIHFLLDDQKAIVRDAKHYFQVLRETDLPGVVTIGGSDLIKLAVRWRKWDAVEALIPLWSEQSSEVEAPSLALQIASDMVYTRNYWPAYNLLQAQKDRLNEPEQHFLACFLQMECVKGLLVSNLTLERAIRLGTFHREILGRSEETSAQVLIECIHEALEAYSQVPNPSPQAKRQKSALESTLMSAMSRKRKAEQGHAE